MQLTDQLFYLLSTGYKMGIILCFDTLDIALLNP